MNVNMADALELIKYASIFLIGFFLGRISMAMQYAFIKKKVKKE